jgi:hypothetical protein
MLPGWASNSRMQAVASHQLGTGAAKSTKTYNVQCMITVALVLHSLYGAIHGRPVGHTIHLAQYFGLLTDE